MTNLMHQLQAWADEGLYRFPNGDDIVSVARCFTKPVGVFQLTPEQNFGIQCVLDGTIQVWLPVEYYPLKEGATVLVRINPKLKIVKKCF